MIPQMEPWFDEAEAKAVAFYMQSGGWLTEHTKTRELEGLLANYVGAKHCIMTANGTLALYAMMSVLNIGPGDEVIVPDMTMIATANAVRMVGATPIFVDIDENTLCLDLKLVKGAIGDNTAAILLVSLRRALAQVGTLELRQPGEKVNWGDYDWVWMLAKGHRLKKRPPICTVMYGGDTNHGNIQEMLNMEPDILLTPYPSAWRDNFRIPKRTRVVFGCRAASSFYTRHVTKKKLNLLVIGALGNRIYVPRQALAAQIKPLAKKYSIGFSHLFGWHCSRHYGPVQYRTKEGKTVRYLNKWAEFLSSARYVVFGHMAGITKEYMPIKVYECLGSKAIPILPVVKDFKLLGIEPMVHYVPLSQVWRNNARLEQLLNHYDDYKYIAVNAVQWHKENMDKMLFDDFESLIHEVTGRRYPKRRL